MSSDDSSFDSDLLLDSWEECCDKHKKKKQSASKKHKKCEQPKPIWPYRSYDGSNNNLDHPHWGAANTNLVRVGHSQYADGISTMAPRDAHPRDVSNAICQYPSDKKEIFDKHDISDYCWGWGQFLDHELDLTPTTGNEHEDMLSPADDPVLPDAIIPFSRSIYNPRTGTSKKNPRQQVNTISAYIDASNVYGSSPERAYKLRRLDGSGKLLSSIGDNGEELLPLNTLGLPNDIPHGSNPADFFVAGDIRANENVFLLSFHTLFLREHNRLCDELIDEHPEWKGNDELIYQQARARVAGFMQVITFHEFLPLLLGRKWRRSHCQYKGYDPCVNASIANEFSTFAYRLGHSMVSPELKIGPAGEEQSSISLEAAFFQPAFVKENGVDNLLIGASTQVMQKLDNFIVEDLRSFLFGPPGQPPHTMRDLACFNIQRGRDHGIADYNTCRESYDLKRIKHFHEITDNEKLAKDLKKVYDNDIDAIDPWVGALCEDPTCFSVDALVGPLLYEALRDQFERLRDGDRFWYENDHVLSNKVKYEISRTRLSDIIKRNTDLKHVPKDIFRVKKDCAKLVYCDCSHPHSQHKKKHSKRKSC